MSYSHYFTLLLPNCWYLDINSDQEYLNTQEFLCYLRTEEVQERLHAGARHYETRLIRPFLDSSLVFNSQESLQWLLNSDKIKSVFDSFLSKKMSDLILQSVGGERQHEHGRPHPGGQQADQRPHLGQSSTVQTDADQTVSFRRQNRWGSEGPVTSRMSGAHLVHVLAGTYSEGGGGALSYLTLRSAGHFVSISQPRLAVRILQILSSGAFQTCY